MNVYCTLPWNIMERVQNILNPGTYWQDSYGSSLIGSLWDLTPCLLTVSWVKQNGNQKWDENLAGYCYYKVVSIYHWAFSIVTLPLPQWHVSNKILTFWAIHITLLQHALDPEATVHAKKKKKKRERERERGTFRSLRTYLYIIELQWIKCQWKLGKWREKSHTYFIHVSNSPVDSRHLSNEVGGSLSNLFQHWKKTVQSHWLVACNLYENA